VVVSVNSFVVLGCGAFAIAAGGAMHSRVELLRRWLIPPTIVGGLLLAIPTLLLRHSGWVLEVDSTVRQLAMVALFTSIGFNMSREAIARGGRPVFILLGMFWLGAMVQNAVGVTMARALGLHPLLGIATGAVALAGGPATSLAFGPDLEKAGAQGATSAALAAAILGILVAGLLTGSLGAAVIRRDSLRPDVEPPLGISSASSPEGAGEFLPTLILFGAAMGLGHLLMEAMNSWLRAYHTSLPAYAGAMIVAAAIRACSTKFSLLAVSPAWNDAMSAAALSWFIPLAIWTLRYWELAQLAPPILVMLAVQLPLTIALAWMAYCLVGRTFDSAVMASAYFGFMFGTMANSLAAMDELQRRYGPSPRAFLVIPLAGGVLSDFANLFAIVLSRTLFAGGL
jgi:glutamate:Na+ symporter, ESS family